MNVHQQVCALQHMHSHTPCFSRPPPPKETARKRWCYTWAKMFIDPTLPMSMVTVTLCNSIAAMNHSAFAAGALHALGFPLRTAVPKVHEQGNAWVSNAGGSDKRCILTDVATNGNANPCQLLSFMLTVLCHEQLATCKPHTRSNCKPTRLAAAKNPCPSANPALLQQGRCSTRHDLCLSTQQRGAQGVHMHPSLPIQLKGDKPSLLKGDEPSLLKGDKPSLLQGDEPSLHTSQTNQHTHIHRVPARCRTTAVLWQRVTMVMTMHHR